jgi:hypothetical protein
MNEELWCGNPAPIADLSSETERRRLSPPGLKAYSKIVEKWNLSTEEACHLLDAGSAENYEAMRQNPETQFLNEEQMYRISFVIGIYKALHILHSDNLADRWIKMRNRNDIFSCNSPLEFMLQGGIPAMRNVRRLLDAYCLEC